MGKITEYLISLITKQVDDKGIVVWYDPEKAYKGVIDHLSILDTKVFRYEGSYFALRALLELFLEFIDDNGKPRPEREIGAGVGPRKGVEILRQWQEIGPKIGLKTAFSA